MHDQISQQREYYARTAEHYEAMHLVPDDEHGIALSAFIGIAELKGVNSLLDVGAGTGRALRLLQERTNIRHLIGVEPVAELREVGHRNGIPPDQLVDGDANRLPFADNSFDFVIETAVLHHVPNPAKVVSEMVRVARLGVMISDGNKFGQGGVIARRFKSLIRTLGLWNVFIWVQTRGKMSKWSEGDGLFYSYSVYDNVTELKVKFPKLLYMNTKAMSGIDIRSSADTLMVIALKD